MYSFVSSKRLGRWLGLTTLQWLDRIILQQSAHSFAVSEDSKEPSLPTREADVVNDAEPLPNIHQNRAEIERKLHRLSSLSARQSSLFSAVRMTLEVLMGTQQDILDQIEGLKELIQADTARDQEAVNVLVSTIADLRTQIAAGEDVDAEEILAKLEEAKALIVPVDVGGATSPSPLPPGETEVPGSSPA